MTRDQQLQLWDAINRYVETCGGNPGGVPNPARERAVVAVEMAILKIEAESNTYLEGGMRGKDGIYPSWVYEASAAILHRDHNIPWLNDLLAALEWQGGTIYDALNCVRRLVAAEKKREQDFDDEQADLGANAPFNLNG